MTYYISTLLSGLAIVILWQLYRAALPNPIPGIPYVYKSSRRILGDVPDALDHHARTSELISFLVQRGKELQSPVIQVFMRPFRRPWVVLLDGREAQDIMARRGREFDRAEFFRDLTEVTFPHNQVHMPTNDQWRFNRRLAGNAMSRQFLNRVAAPQIYNSALDLIELWHQKVRLSRGHTIDVSEDIRLCTVDTIWAATFGADFGSCRSQTQGLAAYEEIELPESKDKLLHLPNVQPPTPFLALKSVAESSEIPMNSPFGRSHHWFASKFDHKLRQAIRCKDQLVREQVNDAWDRLRGSMEARPDAVKSAVDLILEREAIIARKEGRAPEPHSEFIHDELAGFLNAGFETTATTISWAIKFLTRYTNIQRKLRENLRETFKDVLEATISPSAEEITMTSIPYLDAVIEEILRCSSVIPANVRTATVDAQILGYHIPKNTDVFMPTTGPSYDSPPMDIEEHKRSPSSRQFQADGRRWAAQNLADFDPERWLTRSANGTVSFDSHAAPQQMFGAGIRSCFGRKLGYLEIRIILALLIWNFELHPTPTGLTDSRATDGLTHQPQNVRVSLGLTGMSGV